MKKPNFKNKKIAILGLGVEGISSIKFFLKNKAKITVLDRDKKIAGDIQVLRLSDKAEIITGDNYLENLNDYDLIVKSPGINPQLLKNPAQAKITSQTKIFFDFCPCPIIGVTGTKGKGTTASLIYEMLKKHGKDAYLGGNIGNPPLDFLDKLDEQSLVVLEISSFQLQDLTRSPQIAVLLMTTSEHLDYHKDVDEYIAAKRNILRFQTPKDFAVINRDYSASNESNMHTKAKIFKISREKETENGCYVQNGKVWVSINNIKEAIINTLEILIPGKHNFENVCAAVMTATILNVPKKNIIAVLKTFKGLEHRLELVREAAGVRYYDDSFSTTPETAIAAIQSFQSPEILILGGSSKNSDFMELGKIIGSAKNIKAIIGIGVEWEKIKSKIENQKSKIFLIEGAKDMRTIVAACSKIARSGDVVLLSPACASFDMFKNYKDRGNQFKKEVDKISNS